MRLIRLLETSLCVIFLLTILSACVHEGPAERTGKKIDNMVEKAEEKLEQVEEQVDPNGPVEELGENIDEAAEEINDEMQQIKENLEEATKN